MTNTNAVAASQKATRKEWLSLAVLALPTLLVSMDFTVTNLAIPAISADLKPHNTQLLWITDIYGFLNAGLLIVMGTLGDRVGVKRLLLGGAIIFGIASVFGAYATSAGMLILWRGVMGVAGTTLLTSILSIIRNIFNDDRERTLAFGAYTTCFSFGTMAGPVVGGLLLGQFWWGSVFLIAVPILVLLLVTGPFLLPNFRNEKVGKFDLFSALLLMTAMLSITYGIKQTAQNGTDWQAIAEIAAGLIIGFAFISRQKKLSHPLIDLSLFKSAIFNAALIMLFVGLFTWAGTQLFVSQYFQLMMGMSAFSAGLWTIPSAAFSLIGCMTAPHTLRFIKRGNAMTIALLIMVAGIFALALVKRQNDLTFLVLGTCLITLGCSTIVTLGIDMVVSLAPPERAGAAAGISETFTGFGSALGIAILGSIGTFVYRSHTSASALSGLSPEQIKTTQGSLGGAINIAKSLHNQSGNALLNAAHSSFGHAFGFTMLFAAIFMLMIAIILGIILKKAK